MKGVDAEIERLRARLAEAEREWDAMRELLREARYAVAEAADEWGYPYQACLDRIDAALERTPEPAQPGGRVR